MHHHHHTHIVTGANHPQKSQQHILIIAIILNIAFVATESAVGLWQDSLSLLSDAGHNLGDVLSLVLVLIGIKLAQLHSGQTFTYGYKKSTILISLANAIILLIAVGAIVAESIHKFQSPAAIDGAVISWTAGIGIIVNGLTTLMLMGGEQQDLNMRGAFLHMAADTLVSAGVVVSGIIIHFTNWYVTDPIISIVIAIVILISTWRLLTDSLRLALDGTPQDITLSDTEQLLKNTIHVENVHHIHIWAISTTENAMTAHIVIDDIMNTDTVRQEIKKALKEHNIHHSTIEIETAASACTERVCAI